MNTLDIIFESKKAMFPLKRNSLKAALLNSSKPAIIGEIKRGSPSKGHFAQNLDIESTVSRYLRKEVVAFSVLTDEDFFYGGFNDLKLVRELTTKPILCKDFIMSMDQIAKAATYGADVILLIAKMLPIETLESLVTFAHLLNLEVLMEIHDEEDYLKIKALSFDILGINNRDLRTFKTNVEAANDLYHKLSLNLLKIPVIGESGYSEYSELKRGYAQGLKGFLIGESLVKKAFENPTQIKICGIQNEEDLMNAHLANVNYIGFVMAKSKRQISQDQCKALVEKNRYLSDDIHSVVVLKDATAQDINSIHDVVKPDFIQIHGPLPEMDGIYPNIKIIYAMNGQNLEGVKLGLSHLNVKILLFDGAIPGEGKTFNWEFLKTIPENTHKPIWVAGGLNSENIGELLQKYEIEGVDVSSGVEEYGKKSGNLMMNFAQNVRFNR